LARTQLLGPRTTLKAQNGQSSQLLTLRLTSRPIFPLAHVLIAFNLIGSIGIYSTALEALPRVSS
ncbi:MAG TPA: hypothetical protein VFM05_04170, partial [Candidatus Saccharimonadales bacterium]|nr:hypothetical protein [Candidatus Saccharimonadales bacterium]